MKWYRYIWMMTLLAVASLAAARETYVIDSVCVGAGRYYRVNGEKGATYDWMITDATGNEIAYPADSLFAEENSSVPGDTIYGSEVNILWNTPGEYTLSTVQYSIHNCDTTEQGKIIVFELPEVIAGNRQILCPGDTARMVESAALNFSSLHWTTRGDGTFNDETALQPVYIPGPADSIAGRAVLILTAAGLAENGTCTPVSDSVEIIWNDPAVDLRPGNLLCHNDLSGKITALASGGTEPYSFNWSGPGGFSATGDSLSGLAAGTYFVKVTDNNGCAIKDSVRLDEPPELQANIIPVPAEMCEHDTLWFEGAATGGTGGYGHRWSGEGAAYLSDAEVSDPRFRNAGAGSYGLIYTVTDSMGCEARDSITLQVFPVPRDTIYQTACENELPFVWDGRLLSAPGFFTDTLAAVNGCDSITVMHFDVFPVPRDTIYQSACENELPYDWNGMPLITPGFFADTLVSVNGCDSIAVMNLEIFPVTRDTTFMTACENELPYNRNGRPLTAPGFFADTLASVNGCDSIAVINLDVFPVPRDTSFMALCENELPAEWEGILLDGPGYFTDTLTSVNGCDSMNVVNLEVFPVPRDTLYQTACENELPYDWNGRMLDATGFFADTLSSVYDCDSITVMHFEVFPVPIDTIYQTACENELPYDWNGMPLNTPGFFADTLVSVNGCDSIAVMNLEIFPIPRDTTFMTACENELPYNWYGRPLTAPGFFADTLASVNGCDSIAVINLDVLPVPRDTSFMALCENELPAEWEGILLDGPGYFTDTLTSVNGCDSMNVVNLEVFPVPRDTLYQTACENELPYDWNGRMLDATGFYADTLSSVYDCDSITVMHFEVFPVTRDTTFMTACENEPPLNWNGEPLYDTGVFTDTLVSVNGCDSIATLNLEIFPITRDTAYMSACESELPLDWNGLSLDSPGFFADTLASVNGCDSIAVVNLEILSAPKDTITQTICESKLPYSWFNITFTEADTLIANVPSDAGGCDTIRVLQLQTLPDIEVVEQKTICESELPYTWFGEIFTAADTIVQNLPAANGCDTLRALQLQTIPDVEIVEQKTVCESELPYTWFNVTFTGADTIVQNLPAANGCDTLRILQLNTTPEIEITEQRTICESELPYTWFGEVFTAADTIVQNLPAAGGCDTLLTLQLNVVPQVVVNVSIATDREEVAEGDQVTVTAIPENGGNNPVYAWFVNGDEQEGETSNILTFIPQDGDEVYSTLYSDMECAAPVPAVSGIITFTVNQTPPGNLVIVPQITHIDCYGNSTGVIELAVSGGTGTYNFEWSHGKTTQNIYDIAAGTYTVTVTDSAGTSETLTTDITQPEALKLRLTKTNDDYSPEPTGDIRLLAEGGTGSYRFSWKGPNGFTSAEQNISNLEEGTYTVTVTDENGCRESRAILIESRDARYQMSCPPSAMVECPGGEPPLYKTFEEFVAAGGSASSDCGLDHNTFSGSEISKDGNCPTSLTREYSILDSCGNELSCTQVVIIDDRISPEISCPAGMVLDEKTLGDLYDLTGLSFSENRKQIQQEDATRLGISVTDNCEVSRITHQDVSAGNCPVIVTRTFTVYDGCGNSGRCTQTIELFSTIIPEFDSIGPLCRLEDAPTLPGTDRNGIAGSWLPDTIRTDEAGTFEFVFTPDAGFDCAVNDTLLIEVRPTVIPDLAPIDPVCRHDTPPALPSTDLNGITGTWIPDTIAVDVPGSFEYVFTPDTSYDCAVSDTLLILIDSLIIPQFPSIGPLCRGSEPPPLPEANFNGITGSWSPDGIDTGEPGLYPYVFTPDTESRCAISDTMLIEIMPQQLPVLDSIAPLCLGSAPPPLPDTDVNGMAGSWLPDTIGTEKPGTFMFVFTPNADIDCATDDTLFIDIIENTPPVALNDSFYTLQYQAVEMHVLENDYDTTGSIDPGSMTLVNAPSNGTAELTATTGIFTYTPEFGFLGYDTLIYSVCDDGVPCGQLCDTAQVIIDVREPNKPPVAVNDSFTVMCFPLYSNLLDNDYDPDRNNLLMITWPVEEANHGMVTLDSDGSFIYSPDEGFIGIDSFIYQICDDGIPPLCDEAQVWINVLPDAGCGDPPDYGDDDEITTGCSLFIPEGFSPNGDGVHDFFEIYCLDDYPDAVLRIFDRAGNKLFEKRHYGNLDYWGSYEQAWWSGKSEHKLNIGGNSLPAGNYLYILELGNGEVRTGTVMVAY